MLSTASLVYSKVCKVLAFQPGRLKGFIVSSHDLEVCRGIKFHVNSFREACGGVWGYFTKGRKGQRDFFLVRWLGFFKHWFVALSWDILPVFCHAESFINAQTVYLCLKSYNNRTKYSLSLLLDTCCDLRNAEQIKWTWTKSVWRDT